MKDKIKKSAFRDIHVDGIDEATRRVKFTFMTEAPCDNWFVPEVCICEPDTVELRRFNNGVMPVLYNHDRDKVIGKIESITIANQRAVAEVTIDTDEDAEKIYQKLLNGSLKGVSVGYSRLHTVRIEPDCEYRGIKYEQRTDVTDKWEPFEVSIVSCPADPDCGVGREKGGEEMPLAEIVSEKGEKEMDEKEKKNPQIDHEAVERAVAAERERVKEITNVCRTFEVSAEKMDGFINDPKMDVNAVRAAVLEELAKSRKPAKVTLVKDAGDKFIERAASGLALHYGMESEEEAAEGANEYRSASLRTIAEDCLIAGGMSERELRHMDPENVFAKVTVERAMGSEQFASVIDNFANKSMLRGYKEQPTIFKNFVSIGQNNDFKAATKYRLGLDGEPELMAPESEEFKYQEMADESVSTKISTYGKAISLTREIFINDDMGAVAKAIARQAAGFRRLQEKQFFELLVAVSFAVNKGNLVTTNKNISAKAYSEMRNLMRKQKDFEGKGYIGVFPAFILAADEESYDHEVLLTSIADPASSNAGVANIMRGKMQLFTSPYLTGKAYYAIARPSEMEVIEYTTLRGVDRPFTRVVTPTNKLGIDYQFYMDWGFNLIDYRAFVKNPGQ